MQGKRRLRVVLVPCPFQGHINPMLQLGSILHANGFSITIVHAQYNSPNPSSHPDFSFLPLPDTGPSVLTGEFITFVLLLNTICKPRFEECLAEVIRQQGPEDGTACIIHDELMFFSEAAAKDLKLPSIVFSTGCAATSLARDALFQLKAESHIPFPGIFMFDIQHERGESNAINHIFISYLSNNTNVTTPTNSLN